MICAIVYQLTKDLTPEEIEKEMAAIAKTGLQEILILTGESRKRSNVEYIGEAVKTATAEADFKED